MRLMVCWMALLCGCSNPVVRCDTHLQPINPPAASGALGVGAGIPARRAP